MAYTGRSVSPRSCSLPAAISVHNFQDGIPCPSVAFISRLLRQSADCLPPFECSVCGAGAGVEGGRTIVKDMSRPGGRCCRSRW